MQDVDGDGIADIIVGAPAPGLDQTNADAFPGQVYVVLGSKGLKAGTTLHVAFFEQDLTIRHSAGAATHISLAGSGDFNGDGISDIVVESFPASNVPQGTAYMFFARDRERQVPGRRLATGRTRHGPEWRGQDRGKWLSLEHQPGLRS
jgi:hypothetical protein